MGEVNENSKIDIKSNNQEKKTKKDSGMDEWINSFLIALVAAVLIRVFIFAPTIVKGPSMEPTLHEGNRLITERVTYFLGIKPNRGDVVTFTEPSSRFYSETNTFNKIFYFFQKKDYIKRVIGVEGDRVQIKSDSIIIDDREYKNYKIEGHNLYINGQLLMGVHRADMENASVYVNGKKVDEKYTNGPWSMSMNIVDGIIVPSEYVKDKDVNLDVKVGKGYIFVMGDNRNNSSDSRKFTQSLGDIASMNGCISLKEVSGRVLFRFWPFSKFGVLNR